MYSLKRGEVATILTIAAFIFIGVASLTSSYFLNKPQTTASSAQTSTMCPDHFSINTTGESCSAYAFHEGDFCIKCENKRDSCSPNTGVGLAFKCEGSFMKYKYPECNPACAVPDPTSTGSNSTPTPTNSSSNTSNNTYGTWIDGPGRTCQPNRGGANGKGCGGDDGCRFWEVCINGGCIDTTNNGTNNPSSEACMGDAGSRDIWTEQQIASYNSGSTNITNTSQRACSDGGKTYQHGERFCDMNKDAARCDNGVKIITNDCISSLPCDNSTKTCSTTPQNTSAPSNKSCIVGNKTYAHGERYCTDSKDVGMCNNGSLTIVNDCVASLPCDLNTKQCSTTPVNTPTANPTAVPTTATGANGCFPLYCGAKDDGRPKYVYQKKVNNIAVGVYKTDQCKPADEFNTMNDVSVYCTGKVASCNLFGKDIASGKSLCHDGKIYTCNGDVKSCPTNACDVGTNECINTIMNGTEGKACYTDGKIYFAGTMYLECESGLECKASNSKWGTCTKKPFYQPNDNYHFQEDCIRQATDGVEYYMRLLEGQLVSFHSGPNCSDSDKIGTTGDDLRYWISSRKDQIEQTMRGRTAEKIFKYRKEPWCEQSCNNQGMAQLGILPLSNSTCYCINK